MKAKIKSPGTVASDYGTTIEVDIHVGDKVVLEWYGDRNIPKALSHTRATVQKCNPTTGSFTVVADQDAYGTRTIYARHIRKHLKKEG